MVGQAQWAHSFSNLQQVSTREMIELISILSFLCEVIENHRKKATGISILKCTLKQDRI